MIEREEEKKENNEDLRREMATIWSVRKVVITPIIIGALATLSKNFKGYIEELEMRHMTSLLQKTCVLGAAKVIRGPWTIRLRYSIRCPEENSRSRQNSKRREEQTIVMETFILDSTKHSSNLT